MTTGDAGFTILCEVEPATRPDLSRVRRQVVAFEGVTSSFLIPDNHLGRATVSSIAVAHEVALLGGRAVACVNSRDRNLLGFRRDLLTACAYGVSDFLFVRGDDPASGAARSGDLTVRRMIDETREFEGMQCRIGATVRAGQPIPEWKKSADFLLVQASFDVARLLAWRESVDYDGDLLAGVLVLASRKMANRLVETVTDIELPTELVDHLDDDPDAGVDFAVDMVRGLQNEITSGFAGAHLVPVGRYRQVADRLRA
ncbi:MAG: methylenetetrahydrofolate reductase [Actinomycetota bacterium]